jgi:uncharacterized protein YjbI with pentapeptide repeats
VLLSDVREPALFDSPAHDCQDRRVAVKDLKARWLTSEGQRLAREVVTRLLTGAPLDDLDLQVVDHRKDLRGLWLGSTLDLRGQDSRGALHAPLVAIGASWSKIDFSYGTLPINLDRCQLDDIVFDRVGWQNWRATASELRRCRFTGADIRDGNLDGWNSGLQSHPVRHASTRYFSCDFTKTRTGPYGGLGRAEFEDCVFNSTSFPSPMWLRGASFKGCRFTGSFRDVCFGWTGPFAGDAPLVDAVDASEASFMSLEIYAVTGSGLIVAPSQDVVGPGRAAARSSLE